MGGISVAVNVTLTVKTLHGCMYVYVGGPTVGGNETKDKFSKSQDTQWWCEG